jgi:hypothetical protein
VAQADVPLQLRAAQVEIAILEPRFLRHRLIVGDMKWRRSRFVQHAQIARAHFDFAGRQAQVDGVGRSAFGFA